MQAASPNDPREAVSTAVRLVLAAEARRNEVRVAVVRVVAYAALSGIDVVTASLGSRPVENIAQSAVIAALSVGVLVAIRRARFREWYKYALPALDAALLAWLLDARFDQLGDSLGLAATAALACALFTMTGALRFQRLSSLWVTGLAGLLLVRVLGPRMQVVTLIYSLNALFTIGLLAMWLTDLVRRSMEGAGSRALLMRFLPRELVESAFKDPLAIFGEPRVLDATVLVSDIRGFTTLAERLPPDRVFAFLSELQGELARVVHAHGGVVDKFLGDGMLAVFGLTPSDRDHSRAALDAALEIRRVAARLDARGLVDSPVRIGVGVHTGSLVAGCIGSGDRLEFTIIGDTVNTASRLEAMTKEKGVDLLVSEAVIQRAGHAGAEPLGTVQVRGRERPLQLFTIRAEAEAAPARAQA